MKFMLNRMIVLTLVLLGAIWADQSWAETVMPTDAEQGRKVSNLPAGLAQAQEKLEQSQAKKAYNLIQKWIKKNEDSELMDQALYLKGRALFERKLYYQAFEAYEELLDGYGGSSLFTAVLEQEVEIGRRFLGGAKRKVWGFIPASARTEGLEILDRVAERWPGSDLAALALTMQADHYYRRGRFVEAQSTYQIIVEHYSKNKYYQAALLRNAEATHAQYEGPLYDSGCLTDARIRYERYRLRFPEEAEKLGIVQRIERINWQEAQKHFTIADYYRRTRREEAMRYYIEYVLGNWPGNEWSARAVKLREKTEAEKK